MKNIKSRKTISLFPLFTFILLLSLTSKSQSNFQVQTRMDLTGKMYVFVIEPSSPSIIRYTRQSDNKTIWNERKTLPSDNLPGRNDGNKAIQFCTACNKQGKIFVFLLYKEGLISYTSQTSPGSDTWSNWEHMFCCEKEAKVFTPGQVKQICVDQNTNNTLVLFALTTWGSVYYNQEIPYEISSSFSWTGWNSLGGTQIKQITSQKSNSGRVVLFAVDSDGAVYHMWQAEPGSQSWSDWVSLGGTEQQKIEVNKNFQGRLFLFSIGGDNRVYEKEQIYPDGVWQEWTTLNGSDIKDFSSEISNGGRLTVFALHKNNNALDHVWQYEPGGQSWSDWVGLGSGFSFFDAGKLDDGRMILIATNTVEVYYNVQLTSDGAWKGWELLFKLF